MTAVVAPTRRLIILGLVLLFLLAGAEPASAGTPILVVESPSNRFGSYVPEIMKAEGLNGFTHAGSSSLNPAGLAPYDVVVLGPGEITPDQAGALAGWVNAGGNLIALAPDPDLAGLLGITPAGGTLSNGYLAVDTRQPPGAGIVGETIQFHGDAQRYGAQPGTIPVATLYENAVTPSAGNPAVTLRPVGTAGGEAAAFTFDLARSVVLTRQGNPAWAGQNRDDPVFQAIRTNDLFFPDWVDVSRMHIPQADELQRLFANLITHMNRDRTPVPRFWYLPRGERAAVVMTGDDHDEVGTAGRFEQYKAESPPGCSVANWECVRSTSYVYQGTVAFPDALAASYQAQGFEVALHPGDGGCTFDPLTLAEYGAIYDEDLSQFATSYPSIAKPVTSRFHCVSWSDWASHAKVEAARGIRLDTNYYHFPPAWAAHPGFMTGSGEIMKFADLDGSTIDLYQAHTHVNDEWTDRDDASLTAHAINSLLDWATGPRGFYGLFTMNMHTDDVESPGSDAIVAAAKARDVPIISARQALEWVQGRDGSSFSDFTWGGGRLGFSVNAAAGANGLQGMVPVHSSLGALQGLSRDGAGVPLTAMTVKGVEYAVFPASGGRYEARYPFPPAVSSTSGPRGRAVLPTTNDRTAPRLRLRLPRKITLRRLLRKGLKYRLTCTEPCRVQVRLLMKVRRRSVPVVSKRRALGGARGLRGVLKPGKKAARKLRRVRPSRLTLRIRVADSFGNARVVTRRIRLVR